MESRLDYTGRVIYGRRQRLQNLFRWFWKCYKCMLFHISVLSARYCISEWYQNVPYHLRRYDISSRLRSNHRIIKLIMWKRCSFRNSYFWGINLQISTHKKLQISTRNCHKERKKGNHLIYNARIAHMLKYHVRREWTNNSSCKRTPGARTFIEILIREVWISF